MTDAPKASTARWVRKTLDMDGWTARIEWIEGGDEPDWTRVRSRSGHRAVLRPDGRLVTSGDYSPEDLEDVAAVARRLIAEGRPSRSEDAS